MPAVPVFWTIHNKEGSPTVGDHLNNLRIRKIDGGYELKAHNVSQPFATAPAEAPPFTFHNVLLGDVIFDLIHVADLPESGNAGKWRVGPGNNPGGDPTDGDFTAQAGAGADEDADAASSAYA